jgi:transcriptional regulator with XRE-family HTH domain
VEPLDKSVIGERIKRLRKARGLRQWQMAEALGATQPAVHKYENGILPEVKRLLELARIGGTSVEWILTGRHWENGATHMERLDPEVYDLAYRLKEFSAEERRLLVDALDIINGAVQTLRRESGGELRDLTDEQLVATLRGFERNTREVLVAALSVHEAILSTLAGAKTRELKTFNGAAAEAAQEGPVMIPALQKSAG